MHWHVFSVFDIFWVYFSLPDTSKTAVTHNEGTSHDVWSGFCGASYPVQMCVVFLNDPKSVVWQNVHPNYTTYTQPQQLHVSLLAIVYSASNGKSSAIISITWRHGLKYRCIDVDSSLFFESMSCYTLNYCTMVSCMHADKWSFLPLSAQACPGMTPFHVLDKSHLCGRCALCL